MNEWLYSGANSIQLKKLIGDSICDVMASCCVIFPQYIIWPVDPLLNNCVNCMLYRRRENAVKSREHGGLNWKTKNKRKFTKKFQKWEKKMLWKIKLQKYTRLSSGKMRLGLIRQLMVQT